MATSVRATQSFPEIDRVEWFDRDEARRRIKPAQAPLLDRLDEILGGTTDAGSG